MPSYSIRSRNNLYTCCLKLQKIFLEVIREYDCTILEGHRNKRAQSNAFKNGKSHLKYPKSKHNKFPSDAIDATPYPIDWNDIKRFYHFAGYVKGIAHSLGLEIIWGGDWDNDYSFKDQAFNDLVHYEVKKKP